MKHLLIGACLVLAAMPASARDGSIEPLPAGEIRPTPEMLEKAKRVFPLTDARDRLVFHFRRAYGATWACAYHWGGNSDFCTQTSLSEVRKIDERAEDACEHGETGIPCHDR